ncbi:MAG: GNAT family N-acetyltransferase [Alphaproteobacteria bacterium]|nr:GNAT family N-acetyltransferase [Alphaproteobacteria bacterium]
MAEAAWRWRAAVPGDLAGIRALFDAVKQGERPLAHDRWRFFGRTDEPAVLAVGEDDQGLAGLNALLPTEAVLDGRRFKACQSIDTMVHPRARGRGLFGLLASKARDMAAARGIELVYGFPNETSRPMFMKSQDFVYLGDTPRHVRWLRPSVRRPGPVGAMLDRIAGMLPQGGVRGLEATPGPPAEHELAALLDAEAPAPAGECRIHRTPAELRWRYAAEAAMGYEWLIARRGGRAVAACVWGMRDPSWRGRATKRAGLMELIGSDRDGLSAALAAAIGRARAAGAWRLEAICSRAELRPLLRRAAFLPAGTIPLVARGCGNETPPPPRWGNITGDFDGY